MASTFLFQSPVGGTGQTTLVVNLAAALALEGQSVCIVDGRPDLDNLKLMTRASTLVAEGKVMIAGEIGTSLEERLGEAQRSADIVLIDSDRTSGEAFANVDSHVLVITSDVGCLVAGVEGARAVGSGKRCMVVAARCATPLHGDSLSTAFVDYCGSYRSIRVEPIGYTLNSQVVRFAASKGATAVELFSWSPPAKSLKALAKELLARRDQKVETEVIRISDFCKKVEAA